MSRKLLILDLNGTLLLRSKHNRSGGGPGRRLRTVYSRPFLPSFRKYIFHPLTMAWLDTMVWSSAQPHSVKDMVDHCFDSEQQKFLAIWARDTFGLSAAQYNKKIQTTKDLVKPWAAFPAHSARTTLLLDDSARKAHRHPYNHVCVRDYVEELWDHDRMVMVVQNAKTKATKLGENEASEPATLASPKKASKPKSKSKADAKKAADAPPPPPAWVLSSERHDETLLAVIGILDALKPQPDVNDWIRRGGLQPSPPSESESTSASELASQMAGLSVSASGTPDSHQAQVLWFDSETIMGHWVARGLRALEALQIEVDAGVSSSRS
ncbi:hypothetical protein FB45DRAFT_928926 [Roridomyces roridus]|uniref:Mitochondrial import inner membrane translocase subunit TIM50 n=1 Tax=Roridomyces roridus TaxID=1738132 RepID=A0AAD7BHL0_9AGAR|nr:hypothetical protein FB45DRAFT_928926 [Roridomyces roridus]